MNVFSFDKSFLSISYCFRFNLKRSSGAHYHQLIYLDTFDPLTISNYKWIYFKDIMSARARASICGFMYYIQNFFSALHRPKKKFHHIKSIYITVLLYYLQTESI